MAASVTVVFGAACSHRLIGEKNKVNEEVSVLGNCLFVNRDANLVEMIGAANSL